MECKSTDKGQIAATEASELKLQFQNVSYNLKDKNNKIVRILNDTCGEFKAGRLTAILGPSGAGKTSMLNVLAGFKAYGVTGQFELNGQPRNLLAFRKICSYIPQDFVMLELLTVLETLKVSADLKLRNESNTEKAKIINHILDVLNMQKCKYTLVRLLSGGERKRLSIGIELVTNPPIMFFDEPTSGLDSVASLQLMEYLQRLAIDGRIIVCVVHQPSSRLMKLFDDVLIMSCCQVLYSGAQSNMLTYLQQSGFLCPQYYNPADFVLEVGSVPACEQINELVQRNKLTHARNVCQPETVDEQTKLLKQATNHTTIELAVDNNYAQFDKSIRPKECVTFCTQFAVLMRRHLITMSRNLIAVQMRFIMHIIIGILIGIVYWQIGNDAAKVISNSSFIFFMILFLYCGNAMPSILLTQQDTAVFIREYLNGWYSVYAYYMSKLIADLPMQIICPTLFICTSYFMTGQPPQLSRFIMCWLIAMLTAIVGHFLGLTCGSTFDIQMSIFLVPSITIPFLLFSGFFIRFNELAWFLRPICDISFFRYILEGFMRALYGYDRPKLACYVDFCYYKLPEKILQDFNMLGDKFITDIMALLLIVLLLMLLFFLSLIWRIRKAL